MYMLKAWEENLRLLIKITQSDEESINSEKDKGCEFILILPLSLATIEGFFITSRGEKFFIPSNYVNEIILLNPSEKYEFL